MDLKSSFAQTFQLEVGTNCTVKHNKSFSRAATILESRINQETNIIEYYVHYDDTDHRLDEWVISDAVESLPVARPSTSECEGVVKLTRMQKRKFQRPVGAENDTAISESREKKAKVKRIERIMYGGYLIDTWYYSPYPKEYEESSILYICDHCLKYMMFDHTYVRHRRDCRRIHPPGKEIYRDGLFALYEVHGNHVKSKLYCQCLCYLAKLFIDQKTIFCDLDSFMFYVLCETKDQKSTMVGYFSKEVGNIDDYNLACICILPPFQRSGYGKLLIQLSYELSKREGTVGSPEKPLSDLGKYSYRSYWTWALLEELKHAKKIKLEELSRTTGIHQDDIIECLSDLRMTEQWKGTPVLRITKTAIEKCYKIGLVKKPRLVLKPDLLIWKPPQS
uniref:Histone acetyltransferase n=1 Tax=Syphacia muris TaxID=451379 RepID=A0A0N5ATG5_9BILA